MEWRLSEATGGAGGRRLIAGGASGDVRAIVNQHPGALCWPSGRNNMKCTAPVTAVNIQKTRQLSDASPIAILRMNNQLSNRSAMATLADDWFG